MEQIGTPSSAWLEDLRHKTKKSRVPTPHHVKSRQDIITDVRIIKDPDAPVWTLNDFDIGKKLGEGQFGSVYLARERRSQFLIALKAIKKSQLLCSFNEHLLRREIDIHSHLLHPNILQLYTWFQTKTRIYLVLEVAPKGELMDKLNQGGLPEHIVSRYMRQIISAIRCCHRLNVLHRDLKPENILIDVHGNLKLADFGWAAHVSSEPPEMTEPSRSEESPSFAYLKQRRKTYCGTYDYLSPEICRHEWYGTEVDSWCLGVLCYELAVRHHYTRGADSSFHFSASCTGGPPFSHEHYQRKGLTEQEARKKQQEDIQLLDIKSRLLKSMSNELRDFLMGALDKKPNKRMTTTQMLKHPFITKYREKNSNSSDEESD